jgi:P4 family phage/plasmid primase-like protien
VIQILGLRPFTDKSGAVRLTDAFHEKGWRVQDIYELFKNAEAYAKLAPEDQRWNLFYTVANCSEGKRIFASQDVIPLDIDGIERGTEAAIVSTVCAELALPQDKVGVVYSGNGVHILIGLKNPIKDNSYLRANKPYYRALCGRINQALFEAGLQGKADPVVFSEARLLRMPFTENRKEGKTTVPCTLINGNIEPLDIDLYQLSDMPTLEEGEHIHPKALARLPKPDTKAVQEGCAFLKHCKDNDTGITEPEWYAMLSIVGRLENGDELIHTDYGPRGHKHPKYHAETWDAKLKHALEASGPRTCANICDMFEGCKACPHFGKITSPIQIVGTDTIRTLETGFYSVVIDKNGMPKQGKPNYDDLVKYFKSKHDYVSNEETGQIYKWTGKMWEEMDILVIHNFAERHFNPTPSSSMCSEFEQKLRRTNLVEQEFFYVSDRLNFVNGVLDLTTGELSPHTSTLGFTYLIPYAYEPTGDCPKFKKFIGEVSTNEADVADLITEYMGYCLSGTDPALVQKCAVLYGDGANGKSVILGLLRELVGSSNCTSVSINSLYKEQYRYQMMHKQFNASDETPTDAFIQSSTFKAMVSGDIVEVRKLYAEPIMWKCTTKLIFSCNELPYTGDFSYGMWRRLMIIPFRARFDGSKRDPFMLQKLLEERSDILKYCLEKFKAVKDRSYQFTEAKASAEELADYVENSDLVARFIYDMCTYKNDHRLTLGIDEVYRLFCMWCDDNRQKPMNFGSFARRFGKRCLEFLPKVERSRPRIDEGKRTTAYRYLRIEAAVASNNF